MKRTFQLSFILIFPFLISCASSPRSICDQRILFTENSEKVGFTNNEKILICGSRAKESWKEVPLSQAEYLIKVSLKKRAYDRPRLRFDGKALFVDVGPQKKIRALNFHGAPPEFDDIQIRDVIDHPLSSENLDKIENFTKSRLKNLGYPCAQIKAVALESTGTVEVNIKAGARQYFSIPDLPDSLGLNEQTLRRYDAFQVGSPYREEWIKLSGNRAENDGIVVSSQFVFNCTDQSFTQRVIGGEKRLMTIGIGASTEEFPIAQATWKHVRLDDRGSNLLVTFYTSHRIQRVKGTFVEIPFKNVPRFDLAPSLTFRHQNERTYNLAEFQFSGPLEYRFDEENFMTLASVGPLIRRLYSKESTLNKSTTLYSVLGRLNFMTHAYELYQTDPRTGSLADFSAEWVTENSFSQTLATLYHLIGTHLLEINPVDPPQWILGFRYGFSTTASQERPQSTTRLPAQYFQTLGGDETIRGFGRNELTDGTLGAMTSVYLGTEIRYAKSLRWGLEPFVFFDGGALGNEPFALESVIYYSPGIGVRWSTPFGAVRSTLAHGYLSKNADQNPDLEHFQLFLSFGKEF